MTITIYGIKNCDTMKKARAWLDDHGVAYDFHDYKAAGIARDKLKQWSGKLGWETLLNRAGTTFRKLPEAEKEGLTSLRESAVKKVYTGQTTLHEINRVTFVEAL